MPLQLFLRSIFNSLILFPLVFLSSPSLAEENGVAVKTGISFYNSVDDSGLDSERLSNSLILEAQTPLTGCWSASLGGSIGTDAYIGASLDFTTKVSDDFELFGRVGADFLSGEAIPKLGGGIEAVINNKLGLTMETVIRDTDEFPEYQFVAGVKYQFGNNRHDIDELDETLIENETPDKKEVVGHKKANRSRYAKSCPKKIYIVIKGDTLWGIAKKNKLNPYEVINRNADNIKNPNLIYPGDIVFLYKS
ncbi:LysM peptidoglycan-binding domain-containing protein [Vibrio owensii]|uniref:LysM peptidoglycan-binding domain-containing protein n=1 Tax=Vibrio owensii TaxID=696485 RepID=UPI00391D3089